MNQLNLWPNHTRIFTVNFMLRYVDRLNILSIQSDCLKIYAKNLYAIGSWWGQSYKQFAIGIYDSRGTLTVKLLTYDSRVVNYKHNVLYKTDPGNVVFRVVINDRRGLLDWLNVSSAAKAKKKFKFDFKLTFHLDEF